MAPLPARVEASLNRPCGLSPSTPCWAAEIRAAAAAWEGLCFLTLFYSTTVLESTAYAERQTLERRPLPPREGHAASQPPSASLPTSAAPPPAQLGDIPAGRGIAPDPGAVGKIVGGDEIEHAGVLINRRIRKRALASAEVQ